VRTAIALDQYRADEAVLSAREAVRRSRARGGDYAGLAVSRQSGSYPVEAYRFINLNEWARYYGDRTYDPFAASSYFDQASVTRPNVLNVKPTLSSAETGAEADVATFNLLIQGLMFDPLAVSGRIGRIDLVRRPFLDTEIGGGVINQEGKIGWQTDASVQGFVNAPVPTSFSLTAGRIRANGPLKIDQERLENASFFIGAAPSADDRFLVYATASELKPGPIEASGADRSIFAAEKTTALQLGAGWSHTLGFQNVVTAALYLSRGDTQLYDRRIGIDLANFALLDIVQQNKQRADGAVAALNHTVGFGDLTMRYGLEAQAGDTRFDSSVGLTASGLLAGTPQTVNSFDRAKGTFQGGASMPTPSGDRPTGSRRRSACKARSSTSSRNPPIPSLARVPGSPSRRSRGSGCGQPIAAMPNFPCPSACLP
jgi:hypothetical protein